MVRTCTFCFDSDHTIATCRQKISWGTKPTMEPAMLVACLSDSMNNLYPTMALPVGVLTEEKPVMQSIPKDTQWLVIHKKCFMAQGNASLGNLCLVVSCLGKGGIPIRVDYKDWAVSVIVAGGWMQGARKRSSRILVNMETASTAFGVTAMSQSLSQQS